MSRHVRIMPVALLATLALGTCLGAADAATADQGPLSRSLAGLETIDTASLSRSVTTMSSGSVPAASLVMQAHAEILRPAPLPDPDLEAPEPSAQALAAQDQASVQPSFYSAAKHFSGDGFAAGSTLDGDHANRSRPGGGMSLSIPVQ